MNDLTIILNLVLASVYGGIIGYVREVERKAAGLRTHMLVCISAALLMMISIYIGTTFPGADASRIAAAVVTGIGFIGAGAIFQERGSVRGITTAASVWICSAIGLGIGANFYLAATATTIITLIVIQVLHSIEKKYLKKEQS
ncbi:MAG: MgtC/SapB family protein [Candidatus Saganbacteria bacterium]|nr:MgtC/SapB family protein [Candidatus Saganbacteria bacterium]